MSKNKFLRKDLQAFEPYRSEKANYSIKLDANESPYALADEVRQKAINWLSIEETLNIYPDSDSEELRGALALYYEIIPENIICGVGSDQLIDYITKAFLSPGDAVVIQPPTFAVYSLAASLNHGKVVELPADYSYNLDSCDIINTVANSKAKLLFLCTPNNPTGSSIPPETLVRIIENVNCPVVVDEAYAEFSGDSMLPFLNKYENMILLKTFSKAFGLAGARVGYAIAQPPLIEALETVKAPYNLPTLSQKLAVWALQSSGEYKSRVRAISIARDELFQTLSQLTNLLVTQSDANFLFIESDTNLYKLLLANGIISRNLKPGLKKFAIRLSVTLAETNKKIVEILSRA